MNEFEELIKHLEAAAVILKSMKFEEVPGYIRERPDFLLRINAGISGLDDGMADFWDATMTAETQEN